MRKSTKHLSRGRSQSSSREGLPSLCYASHKASFARLDGHEAEELGEERDEHDRDQDGRDALD